MKLQTPLLAGIACMLAFVSEVAFAENPAGTDLKQDVISLAGEWRFQLDPKRSGANERWFERDFEDTISLPGTTDLARKGQPSAKILEGRLSRRFDCLEWGGSAWYQRTIEIPPEWSGKRITLKLERTKITKAWLDGRDLGTRDSLVAPHVYELGLDLKPGQHRLSVEVENGKLPPVAWCHQVSPETQSNWNGILGRIELEATDSVWLEKVTTFPDVEKKSIRIRAKLGNLTGLPAEGRLTVSGVSRNGPRTHRPAPVTATFTKLNAGQEVEAILELGKDALTWDEFSPALYQLEIALQGKAGATSFKDKQTLDAGLRSFKAKGTQFQVNGRTIILRGKNDACVFPLTGFAPMDKEGWLKYLRVAQSYGINHIRFHTWCPPDAAFAAADELGVYMQPELPNWAWFTGIPEHDVYLIEEGKRLLSAFGNHPSFVMLTLGNELKGSEEIMAATVAALRAYDPRPLYAQGSNNFHGDPYLVKGDDFWTTMRTRKGDAMVRGSFAHIDKPLGAIQAGPANTLNDFSKAIAGVTVPVIGHETGQYSVFPDLKEIPKYTGVLVARNFEAIRDRLASRGMLDQADDFTQASGKLSALCYRAENELAFRTPGFGGFQLLDLQDFPGQGTATVGILNAFMESKGLISPEAWRQSCAATVLLLRFSDYTWTTDQTFTATAEIAHYDKDPITKAAATWVLRDEAGKPVTQGTLAPKDVPQGSLTSLGSISIPLDRVKAPARLNLEIKLGAVTNEYALWVYPKRSEPVAGNVIISNVFDGKTRTALEQGGRVILMQNEDRPGTISSMWTPDFWCWFMFNRMVPQPGTLGLLMDPKHPALAEFPTDAYSNWQWFDIANASRPMILDEMPAGTRPIVQVIDNFTRCHRLGLVTEFTVGKGRLLLVSCDLNALADKPAPRQLLASLISYAQSDRFQPTQALPTSLLESLQRVNVAKGKPATASTVFPRQLEHSAEKAVDGSLDTRWCAADGKTDNSWQVDLLQPHELFECEIAWERSNPDYGYQLEGSTNGTDWISLGDHTNCKKANGSDVFLLNKKEVRHVRIRVTELKNGSWASIREVKIFATVNALNLSAESQIEQKLGDAPKSNFSKIWSSKPPADCPFKPSESFSGIEFTGRHSDYRCGDTFYPSWASDGNLYSPWTDGKTDGVFCWSGKVPAHTGHAVMIGDDPMKLEIHNTSPPKEAAAKPYGGRYPAGSLVYDGIWYYGTYCLGPEGVTLHNDFKWNWPNLGPMPGFQISRDFGKTWEPSPHTPEKPLFPEPEKFLGPVKMGAPHFVDFGKNMEHSPDGKAYLIAQGAEENDPKPRPCIKTGKAGEVFQTVEGCTNDFAHANLSWITADQIYLARVKPSPETINRLESYEFFAGHDSSGQPLWTSDFKKIKPLIEWNNHMGCVTATYVPGLKKYLMCITDGWPTVAKMTSYILESDKITGPWRMVTYMKDFGEQAYFLNFPSKFISPDGKTLWLCYSANFSSGWNGVKLEFNPPGGRYGLCLHELKLLPAK